MKYSDLKQLAYRTGATDLLDWMGVRGSVSGWARFLIDAAEREKWRAIRKDYIACREQFQRLSQAAPTGGPENVAWIVSALQTVWSLKMDGVISLAVRLRDFRPVAVHLGSDSWSRRYHQLFGIRNFLNFEGFLAMDSITRPAPEIHDFVRSRPRVSDLLELTYRDVDVGRIALSNVLNRNKFAKFDLAQAETLAEVAADLFKIQRNILAAEGMVAQQQPRIALFLEKGLSPAAEIFGVCVARGIPVVQYVGSQRMDGFVLKRLNRHNRHQHPFSLDNGSWERVKRIPWGPGREAELMREFEESYRKGSWFNRKFLHEGKRIKSAGEVRRQLGLDPTKKTAVIFSHVLWDATFFYGRGLFNDYETWLLETVRAACANPRVNWVIKLHPDLVWKLKYEGYTGELRDIIAVRSAVGKLPEHVRIVPPDTDINTFSFFEITDYCVTVRGTIGIEMACYGVPVLTAGTGRYAGMGFTVDSSSAEEYLHRLSRIDATLPMSRAQRELARRFAYALFKLRPWSMRSFEWIKMPIEKTVHPLGDNLVPHVEDYSQFARAEDIRRFADWVASDEIDYLESDVVGSGGVS
jgi:hypothetical protein